MERKERHTYLKIVFLGSNDSGKTSLCIRYVKNTFNVYTDVTIGAAYLCKDVQLGNWKGRLNIWDTGGAERYQKMPPLYFRDADCCLLVYDVNSRRSFLELQQIQLTVETERFPFIVVGSKVDLEQEVGWSEAETWARSQGVPLFLCSAKTGQGVEAAFLEAARLGLNRQSR